MALTKLALAEIQIADWERVGNDSQRALDHADRLPARERYYVEAVYYFFHGQLEEVIESNKKLLARSSPSTSRRETTLPWRTASSSDTRRRCPAGKNADADADADAVEGGAATSPWARGMNAMLSNEARASRPQARAIPIRTRAMRNQIPRPQMPRP
jgi:hypothetical protein